jgi:hypothetical protein
MGLLTQLRDQGLRIGFEEGRLTVSPRSSLTEAARTMIRINRDAIVRELTNETERNGAVIAARDASDISEFPNALRTGALQLCCNCAHFTFAADPAAPGQCAQLREEVMAFVPFTCRIFALAREPVATRYLPEGES